ncbi:hypothetical protein ADL27_59410, partial [Streptomyces sp. NRRL F-6602]
KLICHAEARKAAHAVLLRARVGPVGFLESRTWTVAGAGQVQVATSTQLPPPLSLYEDLCQVKAASTQAPPPLLL